MKGAEIKGTTQHFDIQAFEASEEENLVKLAMQYPSKVCSLASPILRKDITQINGGETGGLRRRNPEVR